MQVPPQSSAGLISIRVGDFLILLLLVCATFLLTVHTLNLQHSCQPLLVWTETSTAPCPSVDAPRTGLGRAFVGQRGDGQGQNAQRQPAQGKKNSQGQDDQAGTRSESGQELNSIAVGAVAATGAAIAGAPAVVAVGAGCIMWLLVRSLMSIGH